MIGALLDIDYQETILLASSRQFQLHPASIITDPQRTVALIRSAVTEHFHCMQAELLSGGVRRGLADSLRKQRWWATAMHLLYT
jgi:hypothetical protein